MGQQFVLETSGSAATGDASALSTSQTEERKLLDQWRKEIAGYQSELKKVVEDDPDQSMRWMAGTSARLCEMRSNLWDMKSPRATQLRTRHVDPLVQELDRQFKISSRLLANYELELKMTRGMT